MRKPTDLDRPPENQHVMELLASAQPETVTLCCKLANETLQGNMRLFTDVLAIRKTIDLIFRKLEIDETLRMIAGKR